MKIRRLLLAFLLLGCLVRSTVAASAPEHATGTCYAVNLASSQGGFTVDDVPDLNVLVSNRVYISEFRKGGRTWQRLRVGFFGSLPEAQAVRASLESRYPDAWIVKVPATEKLAARKMFLNKDKHDEAGISVGNMPVTVTGPAAGNPDLAAVAGMSEEHAVAQSAPVESDAATHATPRRLSLAGAEYSGDSAYYYAGLLVPFRGSDLGNGFVMRYWLDWLEYRYQNATGTIRARAPGASVALGYGRAVNEGSWSANLGIAWRDTNLSPDDPGSDVQGAQWGVSIGLQGNSRLGDNWQASGIASYTTGSSSYWTRARLTRRLGSGFTPGLEIVLHGNHDYSTWQAAIVIVDMRLAAQTTLGLKVGAKQTDSEATGGYVGVELGHGF